MRLPDLEIETSKTIKARMVPSQQFHPKKLDVIEKVITEMFKKWTGIGPQILIYEVKMTK